MDPKNSFFSNFSIFKMQSVDSFHMISKASHLVAKFQKIRRIQPDLIRKLMKIIQSDSQDQVYIKKSHPNMEYMGFTNYFSPKFRFSKNCCIQLEVPVTRRSEYSNWMKVCQNFLDSSLGPHSIMPIGKVTPYELQNERSSQCISDIAIL